MRENRKRNVITNNPVTGRTIVSSPNRFGLSGRPFHKWDLNTNGLGIGRYSPESGLWGLVFTWSRADGTFITRHAGFFFADDGLPFIGDITTAGNWHDSMVPGSAGYGATIQPTGGYLFNAVWRNKNAFVTTAS